MGFPAVLSVTRDGLEGVRAPGFEILFQRFHGGLRSGEDVARKASFSLDLPVDGGRVALVERKARKILQPQTAVAIDLCVGEPSMQITPLRGISAQQFGGGMKADFAQRRGGLSAPVQLLCTASTSMWMARRCQARQRRSPEPSVSGCPRRCRWGRPRRRWRFRSARCRDAFVERHPLGDEAAGVEVLFASFEIFGRVERGRAFDPGMDGVGGDDVEFFGCGEDEVAGVVVDDAGARVVHHVVVLGAEVAGGGGWDQRLDFADGDVLDFGMDDEGSGSDARAAADDQDGAAGPGWSSAGRWPSRRCRRISWGRRTLPLCR